MAAAKHNLGRNPAGSPSGRRVPGLHTPDHAHSVGPGDPGHPNSRGKVSGSGQNKFFAFSIYNLKKYALARIFASSDYSVEYDQIVQGSSSAKWSYVQSGRYRLRCR